RNPGAGAVRTRGGRLGGVRGRAPAARRGASGAGRSRQPASGGAAGRGGARTVRRGRRLVCHDSAARSRSAVRLNLSEWALRNRSLVLYTMIVVAIAGVFSYLQLGRSEDPPFTFKAMVVRTLWPGATADEVARQVTERIEKKLMETGDYEFIRSYSRPGESQVIFMARDSMRSRDVPGLWYEVRKKIGDIRATLPEGVVGPFFNDEFGDTFGNI